MKKIVLLSGLLMVVACVQAQKQNLLNGKYSAEELKKVLIPQAQWAPFPGIDDRAGWAKADQEMMRSIVAKAESFLDYEWPYIPATKSLLISACD